MTQISSNAVENVKMALNDIADECHGVEPYLEKAEVIIQDVENISSAVMSIEKYSKDLEESLVVLSDLCYVLGAIPFVGAFVSRVGTVLSKVKIPLKDLNKLATEAKPLIETIKQSSKTLSKECAFFKKEMNFADSHFRNYASSLDMLVNCIKVLTIVSESFSNEQTKKEFDGLIADIETTIDHVSSGINDVENEIKAAQQTVSQLNDDFEKAAKPFIKVSDGINKAFGSISSFFSPITHAFNKILNAIKPIKWLLKALSAVFKKIINPIINKILDLIGINKLLDKINQKIEELLHIDELKQKITDIEEKINEKTVGKITDKIDLVETKIQQQYDQLSNLVSLDIVEEKIMTFLKNSYDSFINQELPDFPFTSDENIDDLPAISLCSRAYEPTKISFLLKEESDTHINPIEKSVTQEYHEIIQNSMNEIDSIIQDINNLYGKWNDVKNRMILCDKYAQDIMIYEQLSNELMAWIEAFEDIPYFDELDHLLKKLDEKINNEKTEVLNLKKKMEQCQNHYQNIYLQFQTAYQIIPSQQDINDLYAPMMHIEDSYQTTKELISSSQSPHRQDMLESIEGKFKGYLSALKSFSQELDNEKQLLTDCLENVELITQHIDSLGREENTIISSQFFHSISLVNQYLSGIHEIILPTKQILKFIEDKEDDKVKSFLTKLGNVMNKVSKVIEDVIETQAFDEFVEKVLPFNDTINKINQANQILSKADFTIIDTLKSDIENLKKNYLQPPLQYQDDDGNTVYDYYMNQNLKDMIEKGGIE